MENKNGMIIVAIVAILSIFLMVLFAGKPIANAQNNDLAGQAFMTSAMEPETDCSLTGVKHSFAPGTGFGREHASTQCTGYAGRCSSGHCNLRNFDSSGSFFCQCK